MRLVIWTLFVAAWMAIGSHAQSLMPGEVLSTIGIRALSEPNPVLGTDDRVHLAYELLVVNTTPYFVTLDKIEAVDSEGRGIQAIEGAALSGPASRLTSRAPNSS